MSFPVILDPFVCCTREIPHNYNNGFFRNVLLVSWKKKNLTAFAEMDSISDQVRLPSTQFYYSTTFRNRSHAFKSCDYKVCSRFTMPALLFVTGLNEEMIKHFCQLEDMIEHIDDKYGRVLTAGDVEHYVFEMISD